MGPKANFCTLALLVCSSQAVFFFMHLTFSNYFVATDRLNINQQLVLNSLYIPDRLNINQQLALNSLHISRWPHMAVRVSFSFSEDPSSP